MINFLPFILQGCIWTFGLVFGGLGLGFIIGLLVALYQVYGSNKEISYLLSIYIWFFRATPLLVLLLLFYYGVFPSIGLHLEAFACSAVVLGMRSGAYQCEIFRSAIKSIGEGQTLAGYALGMTKLKVLYHIIIPQILRISLPGWSNEYSILLKDSALAFVLGTMEILTRTKYAAMAMHEPLLPYLVAGVIYLFLTHGGVKIINTIYERTRIPGLVVG